MQGCCPLLVVFVIPVSWEQHNFLTTNLNPLATCFVNKAKHLQIPAYERP